MYWTSGLWNGQIFSQVPSMTAQDDNYKHEFVSNATVNYFTYSIEVYTIIARVVMHLSGQAEVVAWIEGKQGWDSFWSEPERQCAVYAVCGPFSICNEKSMPFCSCLRGFSKASKRDWDLGDQSKGCARNTLLRQCAHDNKSDGGAGDRFLPMPEMRLPDNSHYLEIGSRGECELACLNNCSCTAYAYSNGCSVWYGDLLNLQQMNDGSGGDTLNLQLAASELPKPKISHRVVLAAVLSAAFTACLAIVLVLLWRCRRKLTISTRKSVEGALVSFRYSELQHMTKNFSEKLGRGSFGSVFKGMLPDSTAIAVKKLEVLLLQQGEKQFRAEVSTIGTIQHVNFIRLHGFCSEGTKKLLVYDYMSNGSLDTQLFRKNSIVLDWNTRYQIAIGIARGLAYLHDKCRDQIIHCDINPENILLDASFVPKVADFGMAKLVGRDFSRVLTTMRGTIGYLAPEWIYGTAITSKADVYSYGMMLLEIISGRRNTELNEEGGPAGFFHALAASKILEERDVLDLLDYRLDGDANLEEVYRACKVAFCCILDNVINRPSMGEVVHILEGVKEVSMPPIPRSLQVLAWNPDSKANSSDSRE